MLARTTLSLARCTRFLPPQRSASLPILLSSPTHLLPVLFALLDRLPAVIPQRAYLGLDLINAARQLRKDVRRKEVPNTLKATALELFRRARGLAREDTEVPDSQIETEMGKVQKELELRRAQFEEERAREHEALAETSWRDLVTDVPVLYDPAFSYVVRDVGPAPKGLQRVGVRAFLVGSEIWCLNLENCTFEFFDPESEVWVEHKRSRLPIPLHEYSAIEKEEMQRRAQENLKSFFRRNQALLKELGLSEFKLRMQQNLGNVFGAFNIQSSYTIENQFNETLIDLIADPAKLEAFLAQQKARAVLPPNIKPLSKYHSVQMDRLKESHFLLWEREYPDDRGTMHLFDTSLVRSETIDLPLLDVSLLETAKLFTARGYIFLHLEKDISDEQDPVTKRAQDFSDSVSIGGFTYQFHRGSAVTPTVKIPLDEEESTRTSVRKQKGLSSILLYDFDKKQWKVMNMGATVMPFAQGIVKSADESEVYFLHSSHGGYVLNTRTWEFSPMNTIGRPQSVHDGTSVAVMEGDGVRAALFLGESRWKRVRIVSARVDTGFSPLQTKAFKRLFRIGIGLSSRKNKNLGRKIDLDSNEKPNKAPTVHVEVVRKRRYYEHAYVLDFNKRRWVYPVFLPNENVPEDVKTIASPLPPLGYAALVPYKNRIYLIGGEVNSGGQERVYALERRDLLRITAAKPENENEKQLEAEAKEVPSEETKSEESKNEEKETNA